ncbi:MAG TPA: hypothetical protein VJM33_19060 [Microthrixaceae bacterium]|nr:hypothetical protein [Microthrixaceae bacterium]
MRPRAVLLALSVVCLLATARSELAGASEFPSPGGSGGSSAADPRVAGGQIVAGTANEAGHAAGASSAGSATGATGSSSTPGRLASTGTSVLEMAAAALILVAVGSLLAFVPRGLVRRRDRRRLTRAGTQPS